MGEQFPLPIAPGASGGTYVAPEDRFEVLTAGPAVRFLTQAVQPPSLVYITKTDALQVSCASSQTSESLTVNWRVLDVNGNVVFSQFVMQVSSNRAINTHKENLPEGFLLSLSCKAAVATTRGQTFARILLTSAGLGSAQPAAMLMSDYVTTAMAPAHPNGRQLSPVEGQGSLRTVNIAPSFAGLELGANQPTNTRWRPVCLYGNLITSAAAGNRLPLLEITSLGNRVYLSPSVPVIGPGVNTTVSWGAGVPNVQDSGGFGSQPLPDGLTLGGPFAVIIDTVTINLDALDRWVAGTMIVEEWLDNV